MAYICRTLCVGDVLAVWFSGNIRLYRYYNRVFQLKIWYTFIKKIITCCIITLSIKARNNKIEMIKIKMTLKYSRIYQGWIARLLRAARLYESATGVREPARGEVEPASGEVGREKDRPLFVGVRACTQMHWRINL